VGALPARATSQCREKNVELPEGVSKFCHAWWCRGLHTVVSELVGDIGILLEGVKALSQLPVRRFALEGRLDRGNGLPP